VGLGELLELEKVALGKKGKKTLAHRILRRKYLTMLSPRTNPRGAEPRSAGLNAPPKTEESLLHISGAFRCLRSSAQGSLEVKYASCIHATAYLAGVCRWVLDGQVVSLG
jgi:hypothetical protein